MFSPVGRALRHYRREHLPVALATAVAAAVLVGALVVGDSVRGSLRAAFTERLGAVDFAILPQHAFSDDPETGFPARLAAHPDFGARFAEPAPIYRLSGAVLVPGDDPEPVSVFGVDDRFFRFHGIADGETGGVASGAVRLGPGLSRYGWSAGDSLLLRIGAPAAIATASFFGEKDDASVTLRRAVEAWPDPAPGPASGSFSLFPGQGPVAAVFLPLRELRRALDEPVRPPRANALLVRALPGARGGDGESEDALTRAVRETAALDERGLSLRQGRTGEAVLESRSLVLSDRVVTGALAAAAELGRSAAPVLAYLATAIRAGDRQETPYSLVAGLPADLLPEPPAAGSDEAVLYPGAWLAEDLNLSPGDPVDLEFLLWEDAGRFRSGNVRLAAAAPVAPAGVFADPALAPDFPGVSDAERMGDWDPPFPVDLGRIRDRDEDYWEAFRALPKAFLQLEASQRLFPMREGRATSIRFAPGPEEPLVRALVGGLPPEDFGLRPAPLRREGLEAARGATDFGAYFLYFSWFLLVAAFVLLVLLYRLGIERRLREIGMLLATGWTTRRVLRTLLLEAGWVALVGVAAGALAGLGYAWAMVWSLSGVWAGAVAGTFSASGGDAAALQLFASPGSIVIGAAGGLLAALFAAWQTGRRLVRRAPRGLLAERLEDDEGPEALPGGGPVSRRLAPFTSLCLLIGTALLAAAALGVLPEAAGFFGAGSALLVASILFGWDRLRLAGARGRGGAWRLRSLAFRAAAFRPGRSLAVMALIASASFTLVAVEAFRKAPEPGRLPDGTGGFVALAETVLGLPWDPASADGREALNLPPEPSGFGIRPLRLAGEDDASCLNLYVPSRPRVLGMPRDLAEENRFPFSAHVGETPEEAENPWRLLYRERAPGAPIPVIGDQNSMTYVLKWPVGEEREFPLGEGGAGVRLRLVGALWDSVFAGELIMAEEDLLTHLPATEGYRFFLMEDTAPGGGTLLAATENAATDRLGEALGDYGATVATTRARLASFHRVENTYLSTFQALGGFGLLLGVFGLGAVLVRGAAERRREWGLLAAAGYRGRDFLLLGFWENALLLVSGLAAGTLAAVLAILPVLGQREPGGSLAFVGGLLLAVLVSGLAAGAVATRAAGARPILDSLRSG